VTNKAPNSCPKIRYSSSGDTTLIVPERRSTPCRWSLRRCGGEAVGRGAGWAAARSVSAAMPRQVDWSRPAAEDRRSDDAGCRAGPHLDRQRALPTDAGSRPARRRRGAPTPSSGPTSVTPSPGGG